MQKKIPLYELHTYNKCINRISQHFIIFQPCSHINYIQCYHLSINYTFRPILRIFSQFIRFNFLCFPSSHIQVHEWFMGLQNGSNLKTCYNHDNIIFCPLVPIVLTLAYLIKKDEKIHEKATMSKFFAGFLDHGPHFVLRLVIVVLIGIAQGGVYQRLQLY